MRADGAQAVGAGARPGCRIDRRGTFADRFCSGGTEANNLAIAGAVRRTPSGAPSSLRRSSIRRSWRRWCVLEAEGLRVLRVAPDREGRLDPAKIVALLDADTALVTLGLANSEVGTIQNLAAVGAGSRGRSDFPYRRCPSDRKNPVDVVELGCDLMTISGHKLGAPGGYRCVVRARSGEHRANHPGRTAGARLARRDT